MTKPLLVFSLLLAAAPETLRGEDSSMAPRGAAFRVNNSEDPAYITPLGVEFRVNSYTTGSQIFGSIARSPSGGPSYVIVWQGLNQDGSQYGVFGQRFGFLAPAGPEFRVNSYTTSDQMLPEAGADSVGNFVVVWQSDSEDGDSRGIYAQRYTSAGVPLGAEFRVNTYTTAAQTFADVTVDFSGSFIVVWQSAGQDGSNYGVFGQRYASTGAPVGPEFQVNTYTNGLQRFPSVASDSSGNFVVVWEGYSPSEHLFGIFAQRYSSAGVPQGGEFRVNTYTSLNQRYPAVASDPSGNFVVAWQSNGQDGSGYGIFSQRYSTGGSPAGGEFRVNVFTTNHQLFPAVGATGFPRFMISWQSEGQDGSGPGVFTQIFNSGTPDVPLDYLVNTYTPGPQTTPGVIHGGFGFVVAWTSLQDSDGSLGVYSQRYNDLPVELQTFTIE